MLIEDTVLLGGTMECDFPASADAVTPAWLTDVLQCKNILASGQSVTDIKVCPVGAGFGQTGDSVRLQLAYSDRDAAQNAPASLFAKFATSDATRRAASKVIGLYQREINFYRVLVKSVRVRAPTCYFADISSDGEYFALLLEDFPDHRAGDETVGLAVAEAELAIDLMTELHGPYWGQMAKVDVAPLQMPPRAKFAAAWDEMVNRFGDHVPPRVRAVKDAYLDAIDPLQGWLFSQPSTLGHGDLRLDNLLFGSGDRDPIVAVDWQAVRPSKGIRDFSYLVSHSMAVDARRAHEHELLRRYTEQIGRFGVSYSMTDAAEDYRRAMLFDFCTVIYIVGININTHERAVRRKNALMTRSITAMLDWDVFDLLSEFR
jgi:hypothetical protein